MKTKNDKIYYSPVKALSADWQSCAEMERDFVRFRNKEKAPALVWHEKKTANPTLSVIIPTQDAYRNGYFNRLLDQINNQVFKDFEQIVIKGDSRQGRAINTGAALAKGRYMLILDDDTSLPDSGTFGKLVSVMEAHNDVGMAGGNNTIPEDAKCFVRQAMKQIPRRSWNPVKEITESDFAEHPCLILRTDEFKSVGGENELIPRGLDPYLREQYRKAGKRVVVVPEIIYHHLPPDNLTGLLRQFFRNGRQAAFVNRNYPQWMIETPEQHGAFKSRQLFIFRLFRFPGRLVKALLTGRFIFFFSEIAYAAGFTSELLFNKREF